MFCKLLLTMAIFFIGGILGSPTGSLEGQVVQERNFKGYNECRSHEDCPRDYCCTLGMQRYSVPTCFPLGLKNDPCMPSQPAPHNFTLSYPNTRAAVEVQSAYLLLCPCDLKFGCDRDSNSCQDPATIKFKSLNKVQAPNDI